MKDLHSLHLEAMEQGKSHYCDPKTGYLVCTEAYLASRGECCGSGCRHCPYSAAPAPGEFQIHSQLPRSPLPSTHATP